MKAKQEVERLTAKLADGSLGPDEPLFVLRGRDKLAAMTVRLWRHLARLAGAPRQKWLEAGSLAFVMDAWPSKTPGVSETAPHPRCDDRQVVRHLMLMERAIAFDYARRRCLELTRELYPGGCEVAVLVEPAGTELRGVVVGESERASYVRVSLPDDTIREFPIEHVVPLPAEESQS